jgi:hypothetical protein
MGTVISLYDFTGEAVRPWAEAGHDCICLDIQHDSASANVERFSGGGSITYRHADLHNSATLDALLVEFGESDVVFAMAFPVCTDLAVSGARHFSAKAERDPLFQRKAAHHARACAELFDKLGAPYFIENPVSVLATLWRRPDHRFDPFEFGGYISAGEAEHPRWPEYIAPRDAYPKRTCLWTGGGFTMPDPRPVDICAGYSAQYKMLGGKSQRTKDIRSATPRGFARAILEANK